MPWMNAYIERERQPAVSLAFDVSFPKPMLIDPSGKIVEEEDALRGTNLERTLSKYLPGRK